MSNYDYFMRGLMLYLMRGLMLYLMRGNKLYGLFQRYLVIIITHYSLLITHYSLLNYLLNLLILSSISLTASRHCSSFSTPWCHLAMPSMKLTPRPLVVLLTTRWGFWLW